MMKVWVKKSVSKFNVNYTNLPLIFIIIEQVKFSMILKNDSIFHEMI